jgi:hypothetical protein
LIRVRNSEPSTAPKTSRKLADGHLWIRKVLDHPITAKRANGLAADRKIADIADQIRNSQLASSASHRPGSIHGDRTGSAGVESGACSHVHDRVNGAQ